MRVKHGPETAYEMRNAYAYKGKCSNYLCIHILNNSYLYVYLA